MSQTHVPGGLSRQQLATQKTKQHLEHEGGAHGEKQASYAAFSTGHHTSHLKAAETL